MDRKVHERSKKMMAHRVGLVGCNAIYAPFIDCSVSRFGEEMATSTKWQKTFYIETLVTFVFKYRNLGKLYPTYLSTVTVLIAIFWLAMLKAIGVVQSSPEPRLQALEPPRVPRRPVEQEYCQDGEDDEDDEEEKVLLVSTFTRHPLITPAKYLSSIILQAKLAEVRAKREKRDPHRSRKKVKKEDTPVEMNFNNLPGGIIDLTYVSGWETLEA
jgi:hypothetical protein